MSYSSPPIVEAVYDLQFEEALGEADVRRTARAVAPSNWRTEEQFELNITIGQRPGEANSQAMFSGLRLTAPEANYIIVVAKRELAVSALAPYPGWTSFEDVAWRSYLSFKGVVGVRRLSRVALRYINRLDVPGGPVDFDKFVRVGAVLPGALREQSYLVMGVGRYSDARVTLNCGQAVSPLLNTSSYLIDIDIYCDSDLPQRDEDVKDTFRRLRAKKNELFEQIVTDEARALFSGAANA